jgi:hypothetical protein
MGRIAQLPRPLRDRLNNLLRDAHTYGSICHELAAEVPGLTDSVLGTWYQGPYQVWLKHQEEIEDDRVKWDFTVDVVRESDPNNIAQAAISVAAKQLYSAIDSFTPETLKQSLLDKPEEYVRLINALSRVSREALTFQKYRDACLAARTELAKLRDPDRQLTENETAAIIDKVDEILGLK